jgi:hypothetical protein
MNAEERRELERARERRERLRADARGRASETRRSLEASDEARERLRLAAAREAAQRLTEERRWRDADERKRAEARQRALTERRESTKHAQRRSAAAEDRRRNEAEERARKASHAHATEVHRPAVTRVPREAERRRREAAEASRLRAVEARRSEDERARREAERRRVAQERRSRASVDDRRRLETTEAARLRAVEARRSEDERARREAERRKEARRRRAAEADAEARRRRMLERPAIAPPKPPPRGMSERPRSADASKPRLRSRPTAPRSKQRPRSAPAVDPKATRRISLSAKRKAERERAAVEAAARERRAAARAKARRDSRRAIARQEALTAARRTEAIARRLADLDELRRSNQVDEAAKGPLRQRFPNGALSAGLGWLRADGNLLVDELDAPVQIRGVTLRYLERAEAQGTTYAPPISREELGLLQAWGATAVTVTIAQDLALIGGGEASGEDYLEALDGTISAAADAGLYTVVQRSLLSSTLPTHAGPGAQDRFEPPLPNPASVDLWSLLAQRYAREAAVIFDLFRSPHDPAAGDSLAALLPRVTWAVWNDWLLSMLGAARRAAPRSIAILRGLARGVDLRGFPLHYSDGTEPANVVYAAETGLGGDGRPPVALARLARSHPVGVFTWHSRPGEEAAVVAAGRRLARAGFHWIAADWAGTEMPLVRRRADRVVRPTPLGLAFASAMVQPAPPEANTARTFASRRPPPPALPVAEPPPPRDPFAPPGAPGNRWARFGTDGRIPDGYRPRLNEALGLAYAEAAKPAFQQVFNRTVGAFTGKSLGPDACRDALDAMILHLAETATDPRAVRELEQDRASAAHDPLYQAPPAFSIVSGRDVWIVEAQLSRPASVLAGTLLHESAHLAGAPSHVLAEIALEAIHRASYPRR